MKEFGDRAADQAAQTALKKALPDREKDLAPYQSKLQKCRRV